jgi:predicted acetyltransferase
VIEIRTPTPDDHPGMVRSVRQAFGGDNFDDAAVERDRKQIDFERFRIAYDTSAKQIVGTAGTWALEVTLPGLATMPMAGLTWVGVMPTHRRQGVLTGLIDAVDADARNRGEHLGGLLASEATIYGRFGYSVATADRSVRLDRRSARLRHPPAARGSVRLFAGNDQGLLEEIVPLWDRYRRTRVGELNRSEQKLQNLVEARKWDATYAVHPDGFCSWKTKSRWEHGMADSELTVMEFAACTAEARAALLQTVLTMDLVASVVFQGLPVDDPLPYELTNFRVATTTSLVDMLWLKVLDVAAVFGARRYESDDDIVVDVDGTRWTVGNSGCHRVRSRPDLSIEARTLGALALGGASVHTLAAAGLARPRNAEALRRAEHVLRSHPDPWCQTGF